VSDEKTERMFVSEVADMIPKDKMIIASVHTCRLSGRHGNYIFVAHSTSVFMVPQYGICFMSPYWRIEFCGGS
jgi:hypothetical protein